MIFSQIYDSCSGRKEEGKGDRGKLLCVKVVKAF